MLDYTKYIFKNYSLNVCLNFLLTFTEKIVAFAGPVGNEEAHKFMQYFRNNNVMSVVRLNEILYDSEV